MKRLLPLFLSLLWTAPFSGCGDSVPVPAGGDPSSTWPDEVKETEGKFQEKAKANADKFAAKAKDAPKSAK